MTKISTKEKILEVASKLFAEGGYDNTSIRDISHAAEVNLASINYHFTNKQNLYRDVMNSNMIELEKRIDTLAENCNNTQEFCNALFHFFTHESSTFINSFKIFITNTLPLCEEMVPETCKTNFTPPGSESMLQVITKDVGEDVPLEARQWALRVLFNHVAHAALLMSSSFVKVMEDKVPFLSNDAKTRSINCVVEAILNFLKEHPDKI